MMSYDHYLLELFNGKITWWDYAVLVPAKHRPEALNDYWSYLKNRKTAKLTIKRAEWRIEAARKGLSIKI